MLITSEIIKQKACIGDLARELVLEKHMIKRKYNFIDISMNYWTNNNSTCKWIEMFLFPYFKELRNGEHPTSFSYYALYFSDPNSMFNLRGEDAESIDLHLTRKGEKWILDENRSIVKDLYTKSFYIIDTKKNEILFIGCSGILDSIKDPSRMLREISQALLIERGYLPVHASAVSVEGKCLIFLGDKGRGKTTSLLRIINEYKGKFIANDRILVKKCEKSEEINVYGVPLSLRIGVGTMMSIKELKKHLPIVLNLNYYLKSEEELWNVKEKIELLPIELQKIFNCELVVNSILSSIILPNIVSENDSVRQLFENEDIKHHINFPNLPGWPYWIGIGFNDNDEWTEDMTETLECLVRYNTYELQGYSKIKDIIAALIEV